MFDDDTLETIKYDKLVETAYDLTPEDYLYAYSYCAWAIYERFLRKAGRYEEIVAASSIADQLDSVYYECSLACNRLLRSGTYRTIMADCVANGVEDVFVEPVVSVGA